MQSGATVPYRVRVQKKRVVTKQLRLSEREIILKKGKNILLTAERVPVSAKEEITWKSSNNKIAVVNKKGKVTAKRTGRAVITAKNRNGKKAVCRIVVQ